jgi:hypothetical protein
MESKDKKYRVIEKRLDQQEIKIMKELGIYIYGDEGKIDKRKDFITWRKLFV